MPKVFITYSWHDQSIVKDVILPILREHHIDYFIDFKNIQIKQSDEKQLQKYLAIRSLERFFVPSSLPPWENWPPTENPDRQLWFNLEHEIANSDIHLVLMSQCACKSPWVLREINASLSMAKKIIFVNLDNCIMPHRLGALVHAGVIPRVEFTGPSDNLFVHSSWDDHVNGLYSGDKNARLNSLIDMNLARGVKYKKPTEENKKSMIDRILSIHRLPSFDPLAINVIEEEFTVDGISFEFVSLEGAPYFPRFSMSKYPVTNEQFSVYIRHTGAEISVGANINESLSNPKIPITHISWFEAKDYCNWLSQKTDIKIRMPYEIEWEFACRAGSLNKYCFGDDVSELHQYAWYDNFEPQVVGTKKPNVWGYFDMHGNVGEWCMDVLDVAEVYGIMSATTFGQVRVFRGGAGFNEAETCCNGYRYFDKPDSRGFRRGFRLFWRKSKRKEI